MPPRKIKSKIDRYRKPKRKKNDSGEIPTEIVKEPSASPSSLEDSTATTVFILDVDTHKLIWYRSFYSYVCTYISDRILFCKISVALSLYVRIYI